MPVKGVRRVQKVTALLQLVSLTKCAELYKLFDFHSFIIFSKNYLLSKHLLMPYTIVRVPSECPNSSF